MEKYHINQGKPTGIITGFADLDHYTAGLQPGEFTVIAARPSVGKTTLATNIAEHVAIETGIPVGLFELEMKGAKLVERMIASRGRLNIRKIKGGAIAQLDFQKIPSAAGRISTAKIHIIDQPGLTILQFKSKVRRLVKRYGIKLVIGDYLQLFKAPSKRASMSRQQEIADISTGMKELAMELNIHIIALAQLNRDIEKEKGRTPRLSDLRESGQIEADADNVFLLYRVESDDEDNTGNTPDVEPYEVGCKIAKQRNGPTGEISFLFVPQQTRFQTMEKQPRKIDAADVPKNYRDD